ncbi:MAG: hypothetical protein P8Y71_29260 [Pseudolabrys sp.]
MEADHDRADVRFDRRLERRQHHIVHAIGAGIDRIVVAPGLGEAVAGEMLGAGHHRVRPREIVLLVALDHGPAEGGAQHRVFAGTFGCASPAGVARKPAVAGGQRYLPLPRFVEAPVGIGE